jgi:hypothetical protein
MSTDMSSSKRVLINKANSSMFVAIALASFILVFVLVSGRALYGQGQYQNRVIDKKEKALAQLESDLNARDSLVDSYRAFVSTPQNVLGGVPNGTGEKDGDNAKIILDALPSKYDFPAVATSLEKMITAQNLKIVDVSGVDQEVLEKANQQSASPAPIAMPFQFQVTGSYTSVQALISNLEHSIRPFKVMSMELSGDQGNLALTVTAETYYQPEKSLKIKSEVVK